MSDAGSDDDRRWRARSRSSFVVSAASLLTPVIASAAVSLALSHVLPRPHTSFSSAVWWVSILLAAAAVAVGTERLSRRLLPLAALLKMSMLFPDKAPSRLAVVRKAGSTRDLDRRLHHAEEDHAELREPNVAAIEILALATALSRHDRRTRGHSERVRAFTDLIADELRLPPDDRDRLRWSALLHDIGKMTVHPDILNKAGRPTDEEWEHLKQHPLQGRRLIAPIQEWLGEWSLAVEQHHESYDGSGYPFGLEADADWRNSSDQLLHA